MGNPISILPSVLGYATDIAPDQMLKGYMLDIVDLIPDRQEARLTSRGAWGYGSQDLGSAVETGILATPLAGDQVWVQNIGGQIWKSAINATNGEMALTYAGAAARAKQNQVQLGDTVVHFDAAGAVVPKLFRDSGLVDAHAGGKHPTVGTVYKSRLVSGGDPAEPHILRFSVPGKNLADADSYDEKSNYLTNERITALAALRSLVLIFHPSHIERLRGATPARTPIGVDPAAEGDMFLEKAFDRVGCLDPKSIAYWNEYCIFADEHGVHLTDGSTIRNLTAEGLILNSWREMITNKLSVAGQVFMNYYIVTVRTTGSEPRTLICNLNTRRWFRFRNIDALTYFASSGSTGMERVWAGVGNRLIRVGPCFFPVQDDVAVVDANNVWVQPHFVTPFNTLGAEGRKRIRFLYLSYDLRKPNPPLPDPRPPVPEPPMSLEAPELFADDEIRPPVPDPPPSVPRPPVPPAPSFDNPAVLQIGYLVNSPTYPNATLPTPVVQSAGWLPEAKGYARYRLPVGKLGYGITIYGDTTMPIGYFRLYDIAVEFGPVERSRV